MVTMAIHKVDTVNFRISDDGKRILGALQEHFGLSQSSVFELLLREKARDLGIDPEKLKPTPRKRH
jgi:antitoxin component of RelBE/YafQ-DinJ toxin-antitoxin module